MSNPKFDQMNRQELRQYVLKHKGDVEAFHALCDRLYASLSKKLNTDDEIETYFEQQFQTQEENHLGHQH